MLNILVDFEIFHNKVRIYLTSNVKIGMNIILTCWFHSYLSPTFIVLKFFKFCIQLIKLNGSMGASIIRLQKKIEPSFLIFMLKNYYI
jgi:hypothetical protein